MLNACLNYPVVNFFVVAKVRWHVYVPNSASTTNTGGDRYARVETVMSWREAFRCINAINDPDLRESFQRLT